MVDIRQEVVGDADLIGAIWSEAWRVGYRAIVRDEGMIETGAGVPLRIVMELLGHSQISTTADTYGHVFAESLRAAADAMDRALGTGS